MLHVDQRATFVRGAGVGGRLSELASGLAMNIGWQNVPQKEDGLAQMFTTKEEQYVFAGQLTHR